MAGELPLIYTGNTINLNIDNCYTKRLLFFFNSPLFWTSSLIKLTCTFFPLSQHTPTCFFRLVHPVCIHSMIMNVFLFLHNTLSQQIFSFLLLRTILSVLIFPTAFFPYGFEKCIENLLCTMKI